ncbi:MAG TPA: hypothetical protein VGI81_22730 [Tepidisphaeraceae bacterium]|jgi:type VI secretion system secreted protein VgrG
MPSPKSGSPCTLVPPTAPKAALDADVADPGEVEKAKADPQQAGKGKYGSVPIKPFRPGPPGTTGQEPTHWVEIKLVDSQGQPVAGEPYRIELPDGRTATGTLDGKGHARIDGIPQAGTCTVTFPNLDKDGWSAG